ncbi:SdrD B-like domain-containing protein [Thiohalocapsa halophila]|nr:SdrD B-like domain-containing protein [Thiohalocapsa halophila]
MNKRSIFGRLLGVFDGAERAHKTPTSAATDTSGAQRLRISPSRRSQSALGIVTAVSMGLGLAQMAPAATLGVGADIQLPETDLAGPGSFDYDAGTRALTLVGQPGSTEFTAGIASFWTFAASNRVEMTIVVGNCSPADAGAASCAVVPAGDDNFIIEGEIQGRPSGVLLTGEVTAMGFSDISRTDNFDFRITATGGRWVDDGLIQLGGDIGFAAVIEGSTFAGSFAQDFRSSTGRVKGRIGPIPGLTPPGGIASLGDRVFEDLNGNGVQDCPNVNGDNVVGNETAAELTAAGFDPNAYPECFSGIGNVPVTLHPADNGVCDTSAALTDADGNPLTTSTDSQGFYGFENLAAGDYCVVVTEPDGICDYGDVAFTDANVGTDNEVDSDVDASGVSESVSLIDGLQDNSLDAGVVCPAQVGDRLWDDGDQTMKNGQQESGEPGIEGQEVNLWRCDGLNGNTTGLADTATTGTDGIYGFTVQPGQVYAIEFTRPGDSTGFTDRDFGNDTSDSDVNNTGSTGCVVQLASNEQDLTLDAGVFTAAPGSRFGDTLFHDRNGNGIQDGGEDGVPGATVQLYESCTGVDGNGAPQGTLLGTAFTDANGVYDSGEVFAGGYCVEFVPPTDFCVVDGVDYGDPVFTSQDAGTDDGIDSDADANGVVAPFFLPDNTTDPTRDAGIYCQARIGDRLWNDTAQIDGEQSTDTTAEPGIADIEVKVYACVDGTPDTTTAVATLTTDDDGFYEALVSPGSYAVGFDKAALEALGFELTLVNEVDDAFDSDADRTTGLTGCFDVASQERDLTRDAGAFTPVAALGDYCFHDLNGNGIQDDQEPGIPGCTVALYENLDGGACEFDSELVSDLTTAGGLYMFENLLGGDYCLQFTPPADFCVDPDTGTDLGPVAFSPQDQGGDDTADSDVNADGETASFGLGFNDTDMTRDAGLYCQAALGDRVFIDTNADGRQNCGDTDGDGIIGETDGSDTGSECGTGLSGITVNLREPAPTADASTGSRCDSAEIGGILDTQTTDGEGFYLFGPREPGDYCVEIIRPDASYTCTELNVGTETGDSDVRPPEGYSGDPLACVTSQTITLPSRTVDRRWDGGLWQTASLGDLVFEDTNQNGRQDGGEPPVAGVPVSLTDCSGNSVTDADGNAVTGTTTDANGQYLFDNLVPGCYEVTFTPSRELTEANTAGVDDAADSDADPTTGSTGQIQLPSGVYDDTWDAGLLPPPLAEIGNEVFLDQNGDGIRQDGEPGVAGATVTISGPNSFSDSVVTGSDGLYLFDELPAGDYSLTCTPPTGYAYTTPFDQGSVTDKDSNADPGTGAMGTHSLAAGDSNLTIDCGLVELARLGDFVFLDADRDGIQDAGESGIEDVSVSLYPGAAGGTCETGGTPLATTTTAADGSYGFEDLAPGDYCVAFEQPAGLEISPKDQGGDDSADSDGLVTAVTTLASGGEDLTLDQGFFEPLPPGGVCIPSIDFDLGGLSAGDIVGDQFMGVSIKATGSRFGDDNVAMIFDSSSPTGGDPDLGSPNEQYGGPGVGSYGETNRRALGNVLIVSEDLDSSDPDDDYRGGNIVFTFDNPTRVDSVGILDIDYGEDGGFIEAFDADGNSIGLGWIQGLGNNSYQEVELDVENASKLVVHFPSSGSVASLAFCPDIDIRKNAEGEDTQSLAPGGDASFELVVTNTGEDPLTNIVVADPQVPSCEFTVPSLGVGESASHTCIQPVSAGVAGQTFEDDFSERVFDGGSDNWSGPWVEYDVANDHGAAQDPLSGRVRIGSNEQIWLNDYWNTGTEPSIARALDIAGATRATLSFDWTVHCGVDRDDKIVLEISDDGGASWAELKAFTGFDGDDRNAEGQKLCQTMTAEELDITAYAAAETVIRYRVAHKYGGDHEMFKVDNVVVDVEGGGSGGFVNEACVTGVGGGIEVADCDRSTVEVEDGPTPPATTPAIDVRKQAEGPDQRTFAPGAEVEFEIAVRNTGDERLTDVEIDDPLVSACNASFAALEPAQVETYTCSTTLAAGGGTRTFADDIQAGAYDGDDGDTSWTGPWVEYDPRNHKVRGVRPSQDPSSGRVMAGSNGKIWMNDYYDTGEDPSIQRTANLSGADTATLTFEWNTHWGVDHDDKVVLELSADGGSTWQTLKAFTGKQTSAKSETVDISAFISGQTTLRFRVAHKYGGDHEMFKVDNVKIVASGGSSEGFVNEVFATATGEQGDTVTDADTSEVVVESGGGSGGGTCPTPSIDGDSGDWDLNADFFAKLYEAGRPDKDHLADAYVRYSDGTLYVLVLATPGNQVSQSAQDAWVKVYDLGSSTQVDGSSADFAWVTIGGEVRGYEASFDLAPGSYDEIEIHLNVNGGDTASTGKKKQGYIPLTTEESCPVSGGGAGSGGQDDDAAAGGGDTPAHVLLEAESGDLGPRWRVHHDNDASGGAYLSVQNGRNEYSHPDHRGIARYDFDVSQAGTHRLWGRVFTPGDHDDSFWVRVNGGDWIKWNGIDWQDSWHWDSLHDSDDGNAEVLLHLPAGANTLEVAYREDGAKLDQVLITPDLGLDPNTDPPSQAASGGAAPAGPVTLTLEAEDGRLGRWWRTHRDPDAVGGRYLEIKRGKTSTRRPHRSDRGRASYAFDVDRAGVYTLFGRVIAEDGRDDSFWVRIDGGDWVRWNGIERGRNWVWDQVHDADAGDAPLELYLEPGRHTLELAYREDGTKLDRWLITDDLTYVPMD